ncbi:YkyA family protein [Virgibacillus sp. FSP13]
MPFKKIMMVVSICLIAGLVACSGSSTKEKIYDHLEEAVTLEEAFEKQQDTIVDLEKNEQQLYGKIIDLGMDDFDKIKDLSQQAIETIEKRSKKVELEKESITASKEEFIKTEDLIDELEDKKTRDKAEKMYDVMMNRYQAYDSLNKAYTTSLKLEKELYTMLQKKDIEQETLTEHITKINDSYQEVLEANKDFNTHTTKYNKLKQEFYKVADIEVEYEDGKPADKKDSK